MTRNTSNKSIPSRIEKVTKAFVSAYETGGIPLVLIVGGAAVAFEAGFDFFPDESSELLRRDVFLIGIGLVLAGAVCWTFSVYMLQQRTFEKLRVLGTIVEAALKTDDPDSFLASAAKLLSKVGFDIMVTDTHGDHVEKTVESPNGTSEQNESPQKGASRSKSLPDLNEVT
jgi:hypothetical protein